MTRFSVTARLASLVAGAFVFALTMAPLAGQATHIVA
jgi:hypothetical protein